MSSLSFPGEDDDIDPSMAAALSLHGCCCSLQPSLPQPNYFFLETTGSLSEWKVS